MKITALSGGVGGARLITGLASHIPGEDLTVIVNTGDDFEWCGLYICPDLDTITYSLSGLSDPKTGWGIREDTHHCLDRLKELDGDAAWFNVGDRDMATHLLRTRMLRGGWSLSSVTREIGRRNGVRIQIYPMSDSPVPTLVHTTEGILEFQDYFVRRKCKPKVTGFTYQNAEAATPAPGLLESIHAADAVIVCPSNPYVSIGPILAIPGIRTAIRETRAQVLAVTPIIAGQAIKGPTAAMLYQMGLKIDARGVAALYRDFLDIFVIDERDQNLVGHFEAFGIRALAAPTLMNDPETRVELARRVLEMLQ